MSAVSGQNNSYKFDLHNGLNCPLVHELIHTDRNKVAGNHITLGIRSGLLKDAIPSLTDYVNTRLHDLGARLQIGRRVRFEVAVEGRPLTYEAFPDCIEVSNYAEARGVIDDLFRHREMSEPDRSVMEDALLELEKSAQLAILRTDSISIAQKDIIQSLVSPYIDEIKSQAPDSLTAKKWIEYTAKILNGCDPSALNKLSDLLNYAGLSSGSGKSANFYECLIAVSKIYTSMGDLESALEQSGESLPSASVIQQTIFDLFN